MTVLSPHRACLSLVRSFVFATFVAAAAIAPSLVEAGPTVLDPGGLPVCAATGEQLLPRAIPAADGAAIIVWQDKRRGGSLSDIYALSVAANGTVTPGWPDDGVVLCASGTASAPIPVPDGAGGALVFWHDGRNNGQLYAQRVSAGGVIADGWPADGKQLTFFTQIDGTSIKLLDAISDGAGGAYVARSGTIGFSFYGIVNRFTSDGTHASGWTENGTSCHAAFIDASPVDFGVLTEDPGSGVFFAFLWTGVSPEQNRKAKVAKISSAGGAPLWQVFPPAPSSVFPAGIGAIDIAADGAGGCFTSWRTYDLYTAVSNSYRQRYSAGSPQWPVSTPSPTYPYVEADGEGGAYLIGNPQSGSALEVHRRLADGNIPDGWTASGITVSTPVALGGVVRGSVDDDLLLCWSENRSGGGNDIRAIAIDRSGVVESGWASDGIVVSDATGNQTAPDVTIMSPGQLLACWQDTRTGASDIRATRIGYTVTGVPPGGVPSTHLALGAAWPNPARDRARFSISLAPGVRASAEVVDMSGRVVRRIDSLEPGTSQDFQIDTRGLTAGVYWMRVTQGVEKASRRFAVLR